MITYIDLVHVCMYIDIHRPCVYMCVYIYIYKYKFLYNILYNVYRQHRNDKLWCNRLVTRV